MRLGRSELPRFSANSAWRRRLVSPRRKDPQDCRTQLDYFDPPSVCDGVDPPAPDEVA
jgi:hypothetical protein